MKSCPSACVQKILFSVVLATTACGGDVVHEDDGVDEASGSKLKASPTGTVYVYQANAHRFMDDADDLINRMRYKYQSSDSMTYLPDVIVMQQASDYNKAPGVEWTGLESFVTQLASKLGATYDYAKLRGHYGPASKAIVWRKGKFTLKNKTSVTSYELDADDECVETESNFVVQLEDSTTRKVFGVGSVWTNGSKRTNTWKENATSYADWSATSSDIAKDGCAFKNIEAIWQALGTPHGIIAGDQNITPVAGTTKPTCTGAGCRCWYRSVVQGAGADDTGCSKATGSEWTFALGDAMGNDYAKDMAATSELEGRIDYLFFDPMGLSYSNDSAYGAGTLVGMDHDQDTKPYSDHAAIRAAFKYKEFR